MNSIIACGHLKKSKISTCEGLEFLGWGLRGKTLVLLDVGVPAEETMKMSGFKIRKLLKLILRLWALDTHSKAFPNQTFLWTALFLDNYFQSDSLHHLRDNRPHLPFARQCRFSASTLLSLISALIEAAPPPACDRPSGTTASSSE